MNLAAQLDLTATGRPLEGRLEFQGLQISVENAAGSVRKGYRPDGTMWKTKMEVPYGYIRMSKGVDGDHVDCFVGSNPNAANAYIIHIRKPPKFTRFDEDKVFLGFNSVADAKACFFKHYDDKRFFGSVDTIKMDDFKRKVLATKDDPKQLKAYSTGIGPSQQIHMDVTQTFHPPSLKNPDKVPADQPGEKNNRFGDVTRRHKRELERLRRDQTGHSSPLPSFPGALTTNVQSLQGGGPGSGRHPEGRIRWREGKKDTWSLKQKFIEVPMSKVIPNPDNQHINKDALEKYLNNMKSGKLVTTPKAYRVIRNGKQVYQLDDGHHRWTAAKKLGAQTIKLQVLT